MRSVVPRTGSWDWAEDLDSDFLDTWYCFLGIVMALSGTGRSLSGVSMSPKLSSLQVSEVRTLGQLEQLSPNSNELAQASGPS